jgi:hypothetical protein
MAQLHVQPSTYLKPQTDERQADCFKGCSFQMFQIKISCLDRYNPYRQNNVEEAGINYRLLDCK